MMNIIPTVIKLSVWAAVLLFEIQPSQPIKISN